MARFTFTAFTIAFMAMMVFSPAALSQSKSQSQSQDKPTTSEEKPASEQKTSDETYKVPKTEDDLDRLFKKGEQEVREGPSCRKVEPVA